MKKRTLSWLSALLCLMLVFGSVAFLPSCKKNEEPFDGTGDGADSGSDPGAEEPKSYSLDLVTGGKSDYVIILPAKATDDMFTAVESMILAFKNFTGATLEYEQDYRTRESSDDAKEILIGSTYRPESAAAIEGLGVSQYAIKALGTRLVINGVDDTATVSAIEYFTDTFIKGNKSLKYGTTDGNLTFTTEQDYIKSSAYFIKTISLLGKPLTECKIVYPAGNATAEYVAILIRDHVITFAGMDVPVVSDATAATGPEILIGKTNRTTITAAAGKYQISVTDKGVEAVSNTQEGYAQIYTRFQSEVLKYANPNIVLEQGQSWSDTDAAPTNIVKDSDVRIMYHNVWGYMNVPIVTNPVANRYKLAVEMYAEYKPDAIGFQEMRTDRDQIEDWLSANGYVQKTGVHGGNVIWYNNNTLECLANGYTRKSLGGYDTVWAIFKVRATGEVFGMTNSHFTANSMVTPAGDATEGNRYRVEDAKALLDAVTAMQNHALGGTDIPIICGGDYNTNTTTTAYSTLTGGGLENVRGNATVSADVSCHHGGFAFKEELGVYGMLGVTTSSAASAIDHIMLGGNKNAVTLDEYAVINGNIA
ncbi:MAG: hypothetical protein IJW44_04575, partial [Clostridia bacterium]|nr:hypothetical protein [Clostridia bacterium]